MQTRGAATLNVKSATQHSLSLVSACQTDPELTCRGICNAGQHRKPVSNHATSNNEQKKEYDIKAVKMLLPLGTESTRLATIQPFPK